MGLATLLLATSFVVGSIAGPLSQYPENQCALTCTENKKFDYEVGKSYIYQYEAKSRTELNSKSNEASSLLIKATAEVQSISKCNFILTLRDVEIRDPERNSLFVGSNEFRLALEANPLDFSFQDGKVEALCPRSNEPSWVLNIKRGILSMFQNSMNSLMADHNAVETDITGKCATNYRVTNGGWFSDAIITKSKDMLKCSDRADHYTWIQSTPYHPSIVPQSSRLLKSTHECEHTIRHNIMQKSQCKESHRFQPFASENNGATTNIQQTMIFQKTVTKPQTTATPVGERTTLLFDHSSKETDGTDQNKVKKALRQLCTSSSDDVRPEVPRLFARFVDALRKLSYDGLKELYDNADQICTTNNKAKKLILDAIPLTGSDAGIAFMTKTILDGGASADEIDNWLTTMSLIPKPSKQMLTTTIPLLDIKGHRPKALLAISALTHTYCNTHNDCGDVAEVMKMVDEIANQIPTKCQTKDENSIERVVTLLKALGNIGYISQVIPILKSCYETLDNPMEVRLAAINAHRRIPCKNRNEDLLKTFLNREEDSEVRIGAYLMTMTCPTQNTIDKIEESLINEEVNQVGSFVWTHFTSLKNSENPNKMMVKGILSSKKLQKKFSTDVRKFSRYYEGSIYMNSIQTGAHVDGSVIFSPKSYLPRSTHIGLTLDIFGQSIDLFELGGRLEGFEQLVESFFGPNGHFPDESIHQILESYRDKKTEDQNKLNQIASTFNIKNAKLEQPRGSFYTRMFGNEMQYVKFDSLDQMMDRMVNAFVYMDQLTKVMQGEEIDFTKNVVLLDSSIVIPTSMGLPLSLKVNGTASVNLRLGGKIDTTQLMSKSLTIKGHIQPSAAVEINGAMIVDGYVTRSGLKLTSTVHTSTEAEGEFIVKDGQTVKSQIVMAKDKMEIFDFKSSVYIVDGDTEREVRPEEPLQLHRTCTGDFVSKYFGLELCGEVVHPSAITKTPLLLSGPVTASVYLQKTDKLLTTYDFEYKWSLEPIHTKSGQTKFMRIGKLYLDTRKSAVNRELTAEFIYNEADEAVSLRLVSPFKKATFNGVLLNDPDHKKLDALVLIDDNECLALQSELKIETTGNSYRLTPTLAIRLNGQPVINLKGSALTQENKKYSIDFTMEHVTDQPIKISGLASKTDRNGSPRYDIDFDIQSKMLQTYGKWFYQSSPSAMATKGTIDYTWQQGEKQSITFSTKGTISQQKDSTQKTSVEAEFQWTPYPMASWVMTLDMQRNDENMDNTFTLHYGSEQQRSHNMFSVQHSYRGHGSLLKHHLATSIRVQFPPADIDTTLDLKSDLTPKNLNTSIIAKMTPEKTISLMTSIIRGDENRKELVSGFTRLTYPGNELEVSGSVAQPEMDSLVLTTTGKWAKNVAATLIVTLRNYGPNQPNSWGKEVTMELRLPGQQPFVLAGDVIINDQEQSAHGEAQINGRTYRTFAEYHRTSLENVRVIAGAKSPSTTYSAAAEMKYNDRQKQISTEVVLGDIRRLKSEAQLRSDGDVRTAYANLITDADHHPNDIYSLQMTLQKIIRGSEGVIKLNIPPGTEVGFEWKSKKEGALGTGPFSLKGQYQVWWAPEERLTANIDLTGEFRSSSKQVSGTVKFDTPWTKAFAIQCHHDRNDQESNTGVDIRYERVPIDGSTRNQLLTLKIDHQWSQKVIRSELVINEGIDELRITFNGEDKRTMDQFGFSGAIDFVGPHPNLKFGLSTDVILDQNNVKSKSVLSWSDKTITVDFDSQMQRGSDFGDFSMRTNVLLTTPFKRIQTMASNFQYNSTSTSGPSIILGCVVNQKVAFKVALNMERMNNMTASLNIVCPYVTTGDILLTGNLLTIGRGSTLSLKLTWGNTQYIQTNLIWKSKSENEMHYEINAVSTAQQFPFKFGTQMDLVAQTNRFTSIVVGYLNEETARININLMRPDDPLAPQTKWAAQFQLTTPFDEIRNFNLLLEHTKVGVQMENRIETSYNDKMANLTNVIDLAERTNSVVIKLPFEKLSIINYQTKVVLTEDQTVMEEVVLYWTSSPIYTLTSESNFINFFHNLAPRVRIEYRLKQTSQDQPGSKPIILFETRFTCNPRPTPVHFDADLIVKIKQQNVFEAKTLFSVDQISSTGNFQLSFNTPSTVFSSFKMESQYDFGKPLQSSSMSFAWNDQKPVALTVSGRFNSAVVIANIRVATPVEDYVNNELNLNLDLNNLVGQVDLTIGQKSVSVLLEGQVDKNKGSYVIRLKTPLQRLETMSLKMDYDASSPKHKRMAVASEGSLGKFELNVFHRKYDSNNLNVGAVFTSPVPNFERISLNYIGNEKDHVIQLERGSDFNINATLTYDFEDKSKLYMKTSFDAPWTSTIFEAGLTNSELEYALYSTLVINEYRTAFDGSWQYSSPETRHLRILLLTPWDLMSSASFDGQYRLTLDKKKSNYVVPKFNLDVNNSLSVNGNFNLGLNGQLTFIGDPQITLAFTSTIPNYETINMAGKWLNRPNSKQMDGSVAVKDKVVSMAVTLSKGATQTAKFHLETPFDGFKTVDFTANYRRDGNKSIETDATILKEQSKMAFNGKYQMMAEGLMELTLDVVIPHENYKTVSSLVKIDSRPNTKQTLLFTLSCQQRDQHRKYQLKSELDTTRPGYVEYNLKLKSPEEESLFYANYNAQGVHNVTFDVKLIKGKTMMESRGRFFINHGRRGQGSFIFNSNYKTMITANFNGMYDIKMDKLELALQSNINGANNELMATLTKNENSLDIDVHGECSCPDWQKFALRGWIKSRNSNRDVQITLTRNEDVFSLRGEVGESKDGHDFGTLTLTTPYLKHQSLEISYVKEMHTYVVKVTNNGEQLVHATLRKTQENAKTTLKFDLQSDVSFIESMSTQISFYLSHQNTNIRYNFNSKSYKFDSEFSGTWNKMEGKSMLNVQGNIQLPFINDDNLKVQLDYNIPKADVNFDTKISSKTLLRFTVKKQPTENDRLTFNLYSQSLGNFILDTKYTIGKVLNVNLMKDDNQLLQITLTPTTIDIDVGLWLKRTGLTARYDVKSSHNAAGVTVKVPSINLKIYEGENAIEMTGTLDVDGQTVEASFKSPFKGFEDAAFLASMVKTNETIKLDTRVRWAMKPLVAFSFHLERDCQNLEVNLQSGFEGYESFSLIGKNMCFRSKSGELKFSKNTKTASLSFNINEQLVVEYKNPFVETWSHAHLNIGVSGTDAKFRFSLDNNKTVDVVLKTSLSLLKSSWELQFRNDFLPHDSPFIWFQHTGQYDFSELNKFNVMISLLNQGDNQLRAVLNYTPGKFEFTLHSTIEELKQMVIKSNVKTETGQSEASLEITLNNRNWKTIGRLQTSQDGFSIEADSDYPVAGVRNVKYQFARRFKRNTKSVGSNLSVNGKMLGSIEGLIEINLPVSISAALKFDTPWFKSDEMQFQASRDQSNGNVMLKLQWDPENKIEINGHLRFNDVQLTMTTSYEVVDRVSFIGQLSQLSNNEIYLKSNVKYRDEILAGVEFNLVQNLPQQFKMNLDVITPIKYYEKSSFLLSYTFDINEPRLVKRIRPLTIEATAQLKISEEVYVLEANYGVEYNESMNGQLALRTNSTTVELLLDLYKRDQTERGATIAVNGPWRTYKLHGKYNLKPYDISMEIGVDFPGLATNPITLKMSVNPKNLNIELVTGDIKHYIRVTEDNRDAVYQGSLVVAMETPSQVIGWQWTSTMTSVFLEFKTELKQINGDSIISASIDLKNNGKTMNTELKWFNKPIITLKYTVNGPNIEATMTVYQPLTPSPVEITLSTANIGGILRLKVKNVENYVRFNFKPEPNKRQYTTEITTSTPTFGIVDVKINNVITFGSDKVNAVVTLTTLGSDYSITGEVSKDGLERLAELTLVIPDHKYSLQSKFYNGLGDTKGSLTFINDGQSHTTSIAMKMDKYSRYEGNFVIDTPLMNKVSVDALLQTSPTLFVGSIGLTLGRAIHKFQFKLQTNEQGADIEIQLETPNIDVKSVTLRNQRGKDGYSRSAMVTTSSATHSLTMEETDKSKTRQVRLIAESPYLGGGPYSLTGVKSKNDGNNEMSLDLNTPTERHVIQVNFYRTSSGGRTIRFSVTSPRISYQQYQLTLTLDKIERTAVVGSVEVLQGQIKHRMAVDVQVNKNVINFNSQLQTPLYDIGAVEIRGLIGVTYDNEYMVDLTVKRSDVSYAVKGYVVPTSNGMKGQLRLDTPRFSPVDINVQVSRLTGGVEATFTVQTPTTKHNIQTNVYGNDSSFNGNFRIDSPLLPGKSLTLTANVAFQSPTSARGQLTVENLISTFKVDSEYKSEPEKNRLRSHLVIVTPLEAAPYIKLSGQWTKNPNDFEGEIEIYTTENSKPDFGIYGRMQNDGERSKSGYINIQTSMENFCNIHLKYESTSASDTTRKSSVVLSYNQMAYGYEYESVRVTGLRKINAVLLWGHKKSVFHTEITGSQQRYKLSSTLDAQMTYLPLINVQYESEINSKGKREITTILTVDSKAKYLINAEYEVKTNAYFDGRLTIKSPIQGYEEIVIEAMKSFDQDGQRIAFQWSMNEAVLWSLKFTNTFRKSGGLCNIQLKTPLDSLLINDISYNWENDNNHNVIAKINQQNIMLKVSNESGMYQTSFELDGPITFKYNYQVEEQSKPNKDFRIVLSIPHAKYPLTLSLQKQSISQKSFNYLGEIGWGNDDNSKIQLITEADLVGPNYKVRMGVIHPVRTFDLTMFCSPQPDQTTASVNFKYDASRDVTKSIGFEWQKKLVNDEQQVQINFKYPGIKMMTLRSRSKLNSPIDYQIELQYGLKPIEKVSLEIKKLDKTIEIRVRNPETNYDLKLTFTCKCTSEQYGMGVQVKYVDSADKQQMVNAEFTLLKERPHLTFQASTMASKMILSARINPTEDGYGFVMDGRFNDGKPNSVKLQFRRLSGLKGVEMLVYNDLENVNSLNMSAGMPDDKTIRVTSNRMSNTEKYTDFDFQMNLHQSKELQTRFNWRPESIKEIQNELTQLIHKFCENAKLFYKSTKETGLEISSGSYDVLEAIFKDIHPKFSQELNSIAVDLKPLKYVLGLMYKDNDFHIKSLYDSLSQITVHHKLMDYTIRLYNELGRSIDWKCIESGITAAMNKIHETCEYLCTNWVATAGNQIRKLPIALINSLNDINQWGTKFINTVVEESVQLVKHLVINWIPPISQWKDMAPQWTRHISTKISEQFRTYTEEFVNSKYYQQLRQSVRQLSRFLNEIYSSKFWTKAKLYSEYFANHIQDLVNALKSYPWYQNLENWADKSYELGKWAYKFFRVEDMAKQVLDSLLAKAADIIIYTIEETLLPQYQIPPMVNYFLYEPLLGVLEFNQTLPISWTSFTQLPNVFGSQEYQKLNQFKKDLLQLPKRSATKLYNAIKSEFSWKSLTPAFRATAILAGNQHYVTFDGRAYEFAGACSYLLARDFIDNKFTISVNYQLEANSVDGDRVTKKSFNLVLGKTAIEIKPDLTLTINGNKVETPLTIDTIKITRTNDAVHVADGSRQVFVTYDRRFDVLSLEIGGFYHGKTGGLFGTYDHEPHDDLTDPSQRRMDNIETFASSWEISSGECKSHRNYAYHSNINSYAVQKTCKQLFDDPSLTTCLRKINREPYMSMCVNDVSLGLNPCSVAAVYVAACTSKGIDVSMPESCLDCEVGGSLIHQGAQVRLNGSSIPKSADVVFVLDNTWQCSTTFPNLRRAVSTMATYIEQSLTKNKVPINDNRYALVGLGGPGTSSVPQAITVNSEIFGGVQAVQQAINITRFSAGHHHHISEMIEYAYDLPYRPGVTKILVVVPCSENVDNEGDYESLIEKLESVDIIVHLVSLHDAALEETNKVKASDILGFDKEFAYTTKSAQRGSLIGNEKIRREMTIPKGPLTDMALETRGSVFFASKMNSVQPTIASIANELFSRRVALNAAPAGCQNCQCTVGPDNSPKVICSNCS